MSRSRAREDVQELVAKKERDGLQPKDILTALMHSKNEATALRAATELAKIPPDHDDDIPDELPADVERIVTRTRDGTSSVRVYPFPDEAALEAMFAPPPPARPGCVWGKSPGYPSPDNCGCMGAACVAVREARDAD